MSDLVSIASGAVSIYQRALATVSNNIANVDTEGYTRQELDQKENNKAILGGGYFCIRRRRKYPRPYWERTILSCSLFPKVSHARMDEYISTLYQKYFVLRIGPCQRTVQK